MEITLTLEQISYIKSLDSDKDRKEFLLTAIIGNITSLGESAKFEMPKEKEAEYNRKLANMREQFENNNWAGESGCNNLLQKHISDVESYIENKSVESFLTIANIAVKDETLSLENCQDFKNKSVHYKQYELASKFRQKEKDILDTFGREKLYELVQSGVIQMSDCIWALERKISGSPSKINPIPKEMDWTTTTTPRTYQGILNNQEYGTSNFDFGKAYGEAMDRIIPQDELLKFDAMDELKRNLTVFEIIKSSDYFKELLEKCFNESRLTHPMTGFKHETFEDYFKTVDGK